VNDIDLYVILNGLGLFYQGKALDGRQYVTTSMILDKTPFGGWPADVLIDWVCRIVKGFPEGNHSKAEKSPRGAKLIYGMKTYDIIPAFQYTDPRGMRYHLIPSGDGSWTWNPTDYDMNRVLMLEKRYPRNQEKRWIGYKDCVKLFKVIARELDWKPLKGITSFHIRFAVEEARNRGIDWAMKFKNLVWITKTISVLNEYLRSGFLDPYENRRVVFQSTNSIELQDFLAQEIMNSRRVVKGTGLRVHLGTMPYANEQLSLKDFYNMCIIEDVIEKLSGKSAGKVVQVMLNEVGHIIITCDISCPCFELSLKRTGNHTKYEFQVELAGENPDED